MKRLFSILAIVSVTLFVYPTDYVLISEVMYDTPLNENTAVLPHNFGEYIELYNAGQREVDLSGWRLTTSLTSQQYAVPSNTTLAPGEFLVIAYGLWNDYASSEDLSDPEFVSSFHDFYHNALYPLYDEENDQTNLNLIFQTDFCLPNTETTLLLIDNQGVTRDSLIYGSASFPQLIAENMSSGYDFSVGSQCTSLRRISAKFSVAGVALFNNLEWASNAHDQNPDYGTTVTPGYSLSPIQVSNYLLPQEHVLNGRNYIRTIIPLVEMSAVTATDRDMTESALVSYAYLDAMLRPECTAILAAGNNSSNLISRVDYDSFGRKIKESLPVVADQDVTYLGAQDYAHHASYSYPDDNRPYAQYYYSSELLPGNVLSNELLAEQRAGEDLRTARKRYRKTYNRNGEVKRYRVGFDGSLRLDGSYDAKTLVCDSVRDEDGHIMKVFKDRQGNVVLETAANDSHTYYVYDALGRLTFVLPPAASPYLNGANIPETNDYIQKYCYVYRYDGRGNCIYKKLPGSQPTRMLYNNADLLILSQDGNQSGRHTVTKFTYDIFGRLLTEDEHIVGSSFPADPNEIGSLKMHILQYFYDDYSFLSDADESIRFSPDENLELSDGAIGLMTGKLVYELSPVNSVYAAAFYYDDRYRLIQQQSQHMLGSNSETTYYTFSGKPRVVKKQQTAESGISISETYTMQYDSQDRLLSTMYQLNNDSPIVLSENTYDDYGRLTCKKLNNQIDSIVYHYNIRNEPTQIRALSGFEENLYYGTSILSYGNSPSFNGNISAVTWSYGNKTNGYAYSYDKYNRLCLAQGIDDGNYWDYHYNEEFTFDKQGNIQHITRWDSEDLVNYLSLQYEGNHLTKVTDNGYPPVSYDEKHYNDGSDEQIEMIYDPNGNLIADFDRNICAIRYNVLNLPDTIQFANGNQIVHIYDAEGNRLQTTYYTRRVATVVPALSTLPSTDNLQEYAIVSQANVGNKRYKRSGHGAWQLDYVFNPEGYTRYYGPEEHYRFYYVKDYLGNVREVYINPYPGNKVCVQRTQYYPSGLPWNETFMPSEQPFKYNGKEFVEMHGLDEYDSEARWYYPAIMRTTTMDPLCEKYYSTSPYAWCGNNPVNLVDPDGMWIAVTCNDDTGTSYMVVGGAVDPEDCNVYIVGNDYNVEKEGKPQDAEVLAQTATPYSFCNDNGEVVAGSVIDMKDTSGDLFIERFQNNEISLVGYIMPTWASDVSGRNNGGCDFKCGGDVNRGMSLSILGGKVGTARDVGNFAAGFLAARKGLSYGVTMRAFDKYQHRTNHTATEPPVSRWAQTLGFEYGLGALRTTNFNRTNVFKTYR